MRALAADEYVPRASLHQCGQLRNARPAHRGNLKLADAPHRAWQSPVATRMFVARAHCCSWRGGLRGVTPLARLLASASQIALRHWAQLPQNLGGAVGAAAPTFGATGRGVVFSV